MAYIDVLKQPQVNEVDSLLGIKDNQVVQTTPTDLCLSGLENLTNEQANQVRENINALEDEAGVIDTEHIATGAVTSEKLSVDVQTELKNNSRLIINYDDTRIPAVYWDLLYVTSDEKTGPIEVIPNIVFVDEYGNVFPLQKVLPGDDKTTKILRFDGVYSDSAPDDINTEDSYLSSTRIVLHKPTNNWCDVEVESGENDLYATIAAVVYSEITKPLIIEAGYIIGSNEFWRYFSWSNHSLTCDIPVYFREHYFVSASEGYAGALIPVTSARMKVFSDQNNFVVSLYGEHSNVDTNHPNCGLFDITLTFKDGTAAIPSNFTNLNTLVKLTSNSASTFARQSDKYYSGQALKVITSVWSGGGIFLIGKTAAGGTDTMWMKVPWISEAQLTALKAALIEKFPNADSEHIVQVYKTVFNTVSDSITVGDSIVGYDVIVTGTSLTDTMFYFL